MEHDDSFTLSQKIGCVIGVGVLVYALYLISVMVNMVCEVM